MVLVAAFMDLPDATIGLGLTAPILVNVVLADVPGRDAGTASVVLTTISQIGNAVGVAALGTIFFSSLDTSYVQAFQEILPWQIACYVAAAALMLLLPRRP